MVVSACARHSGDTASLSLGIAPVFETRVEIDTGTSSHSDFHIADFNGDGLLDMAVISLTGEFQVLVGNGSTMVPGQALAINGLPIWMAGGDFDGDGDEDLVIVRNDVDETNIWLNDGDANFQMSGTMTGAGSGALAVAVGDLNNDGIIDFFIGGAKGESSAIFVSKNNQYEKIIDPFSKKSAAEDVVAEFFDSDNDGDLDLYMVSGGNQFEENSSLYNDRILINDGKGNFTLKEGVLPLSTSNGSVCLSAGQYP